MANESFYKKFAVIVIVVLVVVFLNNYLAGYLLQNLFYKTVGKTGIFVNDNLFGLARFSKVFLNNRRVAEESKRLEEENNLLSGQLAELENLKRENRFLRDELGVARRLDLHLTVVQIFNIQRGALASTALINKGARDSIQKSMPLIAAGNVLVGTVDQVFENSASVLLIDDPRVKISGRIQESSMLVGTKGRLHNRLGLDLVAAGDEINDGDTVVTSGLDGLPEALLIGKVIQIETTAGALFKTVIARPLFDPSLGSSLFVILK